MTHDNEFRVRNAFREPWDWLHLLVGIVCAVYLKLPYFGWITSLTIAVIYILYETFQAESPLSSYADLVEFLCGFAIGLIIQKAF